MTAEYYRDILLKRWRLILLCTLLVAVGTAVGSLFIPALYQSTVTVQLITPSVNVSLLGGADRVLQTETTLATSDLVVAQVVAHYPGLTTDQFKKEISAQAIDNTDLFQLTVSDHDAGRAANLANDLAVVLIKQYAATIDAANEKSQQPMLDAIASTKEQIDATQSKLNDAQSRTPPDLQQEQLLQSQLADLQKQYAQQQQTLASVQSTEAQTASFLQVAQAAHAGTSSSQLRLLLMGIPAGLCFGLFLGVSCVLLYARLHQRVSTVAALIELLGWPVLAEISTLLPNSVGEGGEEEENPASSIYQKLNQNLAFLGVDVPLFSIMVTGALSGETANVVAHDLAVFLAREGKRVLLVDANFSQPSQSRLSEVPVEPGLGAAILALRRQPERLSLQPYLYEAPGALTRLRVLPAGPIPPNPEQVLKSQAMHLILDRLRDTGADIVVIAGPSVSRSAGARTLAARVDGVVVVVDNPRTSKENLARIKNRLMSRKARVLGCVVSSEPLSQPIYRQSIPDFTPSFESPSLSGRTWAQ